MSFCQKSPVRSPLNRGGGSFRGFTLIEIMIVVAILGIVLATGIPPMARVIQRHGMNKALTDVFKACEQARQTAVISQSRSQLVIRPFDRTIRGGNFSGQIPPEVNIVYGGVNFVAFMDADEAAVNFYPDGTSDEFSLLLQGQNGETRTISLDIVTGTPVITEAQ